MQMEVNMLDRISAVLKWTTVGFFVLVLGVPIIIALHTKVTTGNWPEKKVTGRYLAREAPLVLCYAPHEGLPPEVESRAGTVYKREQAQEINPALYGCPEGYRAALFLK